MRGGRDALELLSAPRRESQCRPYMVRVALSANSSSVFLEKSGKEKYQDFFAAKEIELFLSKPLFSSINLRVNCSRGS